MIQGERRVAVLFAIALGGLLAWLAWEGRQAQAFAQRQKLPDGSFVELRAVTFGKRHQCFYGAFWQRFLRKIVPNRLAGWVGGAEMSYQARANGGDSMLFWIAHRQVQGNLFDERNSLAVEVNDRGQEGEFANCPTNFRGKNDELRGLELTAFDRRGKTIGLRLYQRVGSLWKRVAQFYVPNPAYGVFPNWKPEPLPITRTNGDLAVTLTGVDVGVFIPNFSPDSWRIEQTRLGFRLTQNGRPTSDWEPVQYAIADATGNTRDDWQYTMFDQNNGELRRILPGVFTPQESAWKLRVGMARTAAATFQPDELWTVRGLPVSVLQLPFVSTAPFHTNATATSQGVRLQLLSRMGHEFRGIVEPVIEVHLWPRRSDLAVTLIRTTGNLGQPVTNLTTGIARDRATYFFSGWVFPEGIKAINLTFAIHQTRYFDFIVQPTVVASNRFLTKP